MEKKKQVREVREMTGKRRKREADIRQRLNIRDKNRGWEKGGKQLLIKTKKKKKICSIKVKLCRKEETVLQKADKER